LFPHVGKCSLCAMMTFSLQMSMLSEPRRRQKWTLNPRGHLWSQGESLLITGAMTIFPLIDDSKFGQKLLEKMGWEKGRGLGSQLQGNVDPVAVRQKEDNKGVGFEGHDDRWIAHQDDFSAVLASLNQTHSNQEEKVEEESEKKKSLEETSKKSRKRVQ